jgi:hypothetical protein
MQRKYVTELALNFVSKNVATLHAADIARIEQEAPELVQSIEQCHIYLIAKRPRVWFVPSSLVVESTRTSGRIAYSRQGRVSEADFVMEGALPAWCDSVSIDAYPHARFLMFFEGQQKTAIPAHQFILLCDLSDSTVRDLTVEYVGMSYGDGSRSAKDRLLSHATLQAVLGDINRSEPDAQAIVVLAEFWPPQVIISMDGRDKTLDVAEDRDAFSDIDRTQRELDEEAQIRLIEAGLIRYFSPPYNDTYKQKFPHPTHKILEELYQIDYAALSVELNTEGINLKLQSASRRAGYHHLANFDLHNPTVRRSFFDALNGGATNANSTSGPII